MSFAGPASICFQSKPAWFTDAEWAQERANAGCEGPDYYSTISRGPARPDLPLGLPSITVWDEREGVSVVVSGDTSFTTYEVPSSVAGPSLHVHETEDRRDMTVPTQNPDGTWNPGGGTERFAKQILGIPVQPLPVLQAQLQEEAMSDLGDVFVGVLEEIAGSNPWVQAATTGYEIYNQAQAANDPVMQAPTPTVVTTGAAPMSNCPPPPPPPYTGPQPVYKKVCGVYKWVYPKRRRRKALVTKQDIAGLSQLKGVLGQGKAMETWIATHS